MHKCSPFVTVALLLAACGQLPGPASGSGSARFQVLSIPAQVGEVVLDLHGDEPATAPDSRSYPLSVQNGSASLTLNTIARGQYTLTARGYDAADHAVVLYKARVSLNISDDTPIALKMNRVTSAITVNASGVGPKSNVLVAKVGGLEARLIPSGTGASGTLPGVPSGRALNVLVEGRDEGGVLRQQGRATLDLSEDDQAVSVSLADVQAAAPSVSALSGPSSVKKGESYRLRVQAAAGGSETLKALKVEWGDGSSDTLALTGSSLDDSYSHVYSAAGPQQVSVTVTNSAGLSAQASSALTVLDTASPPVSVDVGAEVVPVALSVTGVPAGTERLQAVIDAPLGAQRASKAGLQAQDLKAQYILELVPRPDGRWGGALGLPAGFSYSVTLRATRDGQTQQGAPQTVTTTAGGPNSFTLAYAAGGGTPSCPAPSGDLTSIGAVQGSGDASPRVGQGVTVRGVVTLDAQPGLKGFYLQDLTPDGDPATSDGVFVFTASAPQSVRPGDVVQLSARVQEFGGLTELDSVQDFVNCGAGTLPQPTVLNFPLTSVSQLEALEGMLVTIPDTLTVTNNYGLGRYGELGLSSGGRIFNKTNGNGSAGDDSLRSIVLDDLASAQNPNPIPYLSAALTRRTGDTVTNLTGVLTYGGDPAAPTFRIEPSIPPVFADANPRPAAPDPVGGTLRVAGANVLNYFTDLNPSYASSGPRGANSAAELARQQAKIVNALHGLNADVLSLMEVENDDGSALNTLVAALNAHLGAGTYQAVQTGKIGSDAIRVAIIYKPGRVAPLGSFVVNDNADGLDSRPPLAQTFRDLGTGGVFTLIANHLKSKGSCPKSGDVDSGQGCWNALRVQQATKLLTFAQAMQQRSGDPDVLLMGDFNAYGAEDPIRTLTQGGFVSENLRIPAAERYSYQFGGAFGYLDHALATGSLDAQITGITEWHINSDEPTSADYNTEFKAIPECVKGTPSGNTCTGQDLWQDNPYRASDHDPVLVGLNLTADSQTPAFSLTASGAATARVGTPYALSLSASDTPDSLRVNWGDGSADEVLAPTATGASHSFAAAGHFTVTVTASKGIGTRSATVEVDVAAVGAHLVISQAYGGGNFAGATYQSDFVELFNPSAQPLSLSGLTLQYASASGTGNFAVAATLSGTVPAGGYFLVQLVTGTAGDSPLPAPDATGSTNMSGSAGKVALVNGTAALACNGGSTPCSTAQLAQIVDLLGYGSTTNFSEGNTPTANLSGTLAALRKKGGCTDTDNNAADFEVATPQARNSASPIHLCNR